MKTHLLNKLNKIIMSLALAGLCGVGLLAGIGQSVVPVYAQTDTCFVSLNDNGTTDYQSPDASAVQTAVNAANPGDTLKLAGSCVGVTQTAGLTQTAYIAKNLTLRGGYTTTNWADSDPQTNPTTLSANDLGRVIVISNTAQATIENLIVMSGTAEAGGGIYVYSTTQLSLLNSQVMHNTVTELNDLDGGGGLGNLGTAVISGTTFSHNQASLQAGALGNGPTGRLTVTGSTFRENQASRAGALGNTGWLTVTASSFISNTAGGAGAIGNSRSNALGAPGWMWIENSHFISHTTSGNGGAIDNTGGEMHILTSTFRANNARGGGAIYNNTDTPQLYITNTTFISNTAASRGGGAIRHRAGTISIADSTFNGNSTSDEGGAIRVQDDADSTSIVNSLIFSNTAALNGGGIYNNAILNLSQVEILSNTTQTWDGGGLYNDGAGTATISQSTIAYNQARYGGGIQNYGQLTLSESRIYHNTASSDGAGLQIWGGSISITATTIAYNIANDDGGGISNVDGQLTLVNSTVSHNQGLGNIHNTGGGGLYQALDVGSPHLKLIHSTIVSNTATNGGAGLHLVEGLATFTNTIIAQNGVENCKIGTGTLTSGGYNLEDANTCTLTATTDLTDTTPLLGPLADNGGETETHALLVGSPAIETIPVANCAADTDQRGISRPQGANCDIGAVETILKPVANDDSYSIDENNTLPVPTTGVLSNDTGLFGGPLGATLTTTPTNGSLVLAQTGAFSYTPHLDFSGSDSFTYRAKYGRWSGYWPLDDQTDPTADLSGNDNPGTLRGDTSFTTTVPLTIGTGSALVFDGSGDYVDFNNPAELGLPEFTLALWFKRSGNGSNADTGAGGFKAEPLLTKGRASGDGGTVDMNYFLGIEATGDVLAADFEDMVDGSNHPILGTTLITNNVWYHAAASYDGNEWRLYLNGELENSLVVGQTPRFDSNNQVALATTLISTDLPIGYFNGLLDDVRIYDTALNATIIADLAQGSPLEYSDVATVSIEVLPHTCWVETTGDNQSDYASSTASAVQEALNNADSGDVLKIAGTCLGVTQTAGITQTAYISQNLTLQGGYTHTAWLDAPDPATYPTVLDAENESRVVYIASGAEVTLAGLTIQNGTTSNEGGGVAHLGASLVISQSRIISNTANDGGGIYNATVLTVTHTSILNNQVSTVGGGIAQDGGDLHVSDSLISGNRATIAGGGVQDDDSAGGTMTFSHTTIQNNLSDGNGGGVADEGGPLTVVNSTVQHNQAADSGGGVDKSAGSLTLTNTQILSNSAVKEGGGIYQSFNTLNLSESLISGNSARSGGGIYFYVATLNLVSSTLQYNRALTQTGGGINNQAGSLNLIDSLLQHNHAETNGGGFYAGATSGPGTVISNTRFYSNTALDDGGGFYTDQTTVMSNSRISENYSGDQGGAGYLAGAAEVSLYASDVQSNTATTSGGGLNVAIDATFTSTTSTIAHNQAGTQGGGLYVNGSNTQVLLGETTIYSNSATNGGGGLYVRNASIAVLGGQIISNTSSGLGGGMYQNDTGTSVFSGTHISHNRANQGGGLTVNDNAGYVLTNTVLSYNQATSGDGGAMFVINNSEARLLNSLVYSNTATDEGGGLFNDLGSTTHLTNTIISHNQATNRGGGLINNNIMTIHGGEIISNSVSGGFGYGGGLYLGTDNGTPSLTQTGVLTLAYNQAGFRGGALYVNKGQVRLNGARILSNQAADTGGAIYQASNTNGITVTNSCLVFNSDTAVHHGGGPALSATGNWWGAADGPSEAGPGHGDSINNATNIDASGFLTTAPAGCPSYTPVLTLGGGNNQATEIDQTFRQSLSVTLAMAENALPFSGEVITFTGPSLGAGIAPSVLIATTDSEGLAVVTPTANSEWGAYEIIATADLAAVPVTFTLQNYTFFTLNTATSGQGSGTVTPGGVYTSGQSVVITATENTGSTFVGWTGNVSGTSNPLTITMDSDKTITATFNLLTYTLNVNTAGTGSGSVTLDPAGSVYDYGTVVTLTASANTGSYFVAWSGDISDTSDTITVTINNDTAITATFNLTTHTLTVVEAGNGSGTVDLNPMGDVYDYGTVVTLAATADTGSTFAGWSGACTGSADCAITMTSDQVVTATFIRQAVGVTVEPTLISASELGATEDYTLHLDGQPTTDVTITLNPDSQVTVSLSELTFTPLNWATPQTVTVGAVDDTEAEGQHTGLISHTLSSADALYDGLDIDTVSVTISDDDSPCLCLNPINVTVSEDGTTDQYAMRLTTEPTAAVTVTLNITSSDISATPTQLIFTPQTWATPQTVTVSAVDNAVVDGTRTAVIDHQTESDDSDYTSLPTREVFVTILDNDVVPTYTLTVNTDGAGSVNIEPQQAFYNEGSVVTLTAVASDSTFFAGWSGDEISADNPLILTMNRNKILTATFSSEPPITYTLTINVAGNGTTSPTVGTHTYISGTVASLSASAAEGWQFDGWSGNLTGSANPATLLMNENKVVTTTFRPVKGTEDSLFLPLVLK